MSRSYDKIMALLCEKYKVALVDFSVDSDRDRFSACTSLDPDKFKSNGLSRIATVYLGVFNNRQRRMFTFLHELGHIIDRRRNERSDLERIINGKEKRSRYASEKSATKIAFSIANKLGMVFSERTRKWVEKCLATYDSPKYKEMTWFDSK